MFVGALMVSPEFSAANQHKAELYVQAFTFSWPSIRMMFLFKF